MSEVTNLASKDIDTYYQHGDGGAVVPLDPISREQLKPGVVPEGLAADPELAAGYAYLKENANRIDAQVLLTSHTSQADLWRSGIELDIVGQDLAARGSAWRRAVYGGGWH